MGTHPIFESDFDCLTECSPGRALDLSGQIRSNCRFRSMVCPDLTLRLPILPRSRPENSLPSWPTLTMSPTLLVKNNRSPIFFTNPFVPNADKLSALNAVAGETGMATTTLGLFETMAENGRMNILSEVASVYSRILKAEAGEVPCHVSSAIPLSDDQTADVAAAVSSMLGEGQTPVITSSVEKDLLGGMTVSLGDKYTDMKYIDMSVASKVKKYTDLLKSAH